MPNYWIKGTSSKAYAKTFMKMMQENNMKLGNKVVVFVDSSNDEFQLLHGTNVIFQKNSKSTFAQYIHVWKGMGLICSIETGTNEYIISFEPNSYEQIIQLTKASMLNYVEQGKINDFRFSTLINVLYYSGILSWYEIEDAEIKAKKSTLDEDSLKKSIGSFEKQIAEDADFLRIAKERYNEINK